MQNVPSKITATQKSSSLDKAKLIASVGFLVLFFNIGFYLAVGLFIKNYSLNVDLANRLKINVDDLNLSAQLKGLVNASVDAVIDIPIDTEIKVPIETEIYIDDVFDIKTSIPISINLTPNELQVTNIEVPLDTEILIDEVIRIDATIPLDTTIIVYGVMPVKLKAKLPIKVDIPIKQKIHVRKNLKVDLNKFDISLNMDIPVQKKIRISQPVKIKEIIPVNFSQTLEVPIKAELPVTIKDTLEIQATVQGPLSVNSGSLFLDHKALSIDK